MRCQSSGSRTARIVIVGEAPGAQEEEQGLPFVGWSGQELDRMLGDAGLSRDDCFLTNVCLDRPPNNDIDLFINPNKTARDGEVLFRDRWVAPQVVEDVHELHRTLAEIQPKVIIALGNTPLWALTKLHKKGEASIGKWRGSYLASDVLELAGVTVIPTYHPAYVLRAWGERYIAVADLRRARGVLDKVPVAPAWRFDTPTAYAEVVARLAGLRELADRATLPLVCDLEIKRKEIVCLGLAWSRLDALCIPFYVPAPEGARRTWSPEETAEVWWVLYRLLAHPNVRLVNQNLMFDLQFLFEDAGLHVPPHFDTMLAQHVLFPGEPKDLAYLASLYCSYYVYWKDDGKFWDKPIIFPQLWHYNQLDCVYTYEVWEEQVKALDSLGFNDQMASQMQRMPRILRMMYRGVAVDGETKRQTLRDLKALIAGMHAEVRTLAGRSLVGDKGGFSNAKLARLFYKDLGLKPTVRVKKGKTTVSCDDDALAALSKREPWLRPLCDRINMIRSYGTAVSACTAKVDPDGRWRTSYNMGGAENYRLSSSANPFGSGLNLQNLTLGKDITI